MSDEPLTVAVVDQDDRIVITVRGALDADGARLVYETLTAALAVRKVDEVELDLRAMDGWTTSGLRELDPCLALGVRCRMGPDVATTP